MSLDNNLSFYAVKCLISLVLELDNLKTESRGRGCLSSLTGWSRDRRAFEMLY